jgi:hypothetical protein
MIARGVEGATEVAAFIEKQRKTLADAAPDAIVIIAGDHLNQ